jgi:hypothetical protein
MMNTCEYGRVKFVLTAMAELVTMKSKFKSTTAPWFGDKNTHGHPYEQKTVD